MSYSLLTTAIKTTESKRYFSAPIRRSSSSSSSSSSDSIATSSPPTTPELKSACCPLGTASTPSTWGEDPFLREPITCSSENRGRAHARSATAATQVELRLRVILKDQNKYEKPHFHVPNVDTKDAQSQSSAWTDEFFEQSDYRKDVVEKFNTGSFLPPYVERTAVVDHAPHRVTRGFALPTDPEPEPFAPNTNSMTFNLLALGAIDGIDLVKCWRADHGRVARERAERKRKQLEKVSKSSLSLLKGFVASKGKATVATQKRRRIKIEMLWNQCSGSKFVDTL